MKQNVKQHRFLYIHLMLQLTKQNEHVWLLKINKANLTYMSDFLPSCFWGKMIWTDVESFVFGMEWLIMHIARATFPTFLTWRRPISLMLQSYKV